MIQLLGKKSKGFTLVEILIVLVILGILAGLAVPILAAQTRRAYRQEALATIGQVRSAMATYYSTHGNYDAAQMTDDTDNETFIGFNPADATASGQTMHFDYTFSVVPAGAVYEVTATSVDSPSMDAGLTVIMDQSGVEGGSTLT